MLCAATYPRRILWGILAVGVLWGVLGRTMLYAEGEFSDIEAGLPPVSQGTVAWGDYDNDSDLDLLLTGVRANGTDLVGKLYRNDAGLFVQSNITLPQVAYSATAWGDYDNDNDLDLLLIGETNTQRVSRLYQNNAGTLSPISLALPQLNNGAVAWGDYDNDGDLDFFLSGSGVNQPIGRLYRNDQGTFTPDPVGLPPLENGAAAWGDYDNDGDLDLVLAGKSFPWLITTIYRNDGDTFTQLQTNLPGVEYGDVAWADYDNDSDLDLLLTGRGVNDWITTLYRNDGAAGFTESGAGLPGTFFSSTDWGDYDNDGDLDLLLTGCSNEDAGICAARITRIYRNTNGTFADSGVALPGVGGSAAAWGDYDNDGDLDFALIGSNNTVGPLARIYRNNITVGNTHPSAPTGLEATVAPQQVVLAWQPASDPETPALGLNYNLRVGTAPGQGDIVSAMAITTTGQRLLPGLGNLGPGLTATLALPVGHYYWSVQAIDTTWAGSPFAAEGHFTIPLAAVPAGLPGVQDGSVLWGDVDRDGDLDLFLAGESQNGSLAGLYRNDGAHSFAVSGGDFPPVRHAAAAWGDYDRDNDLDLVLTGEHTGAPFAALYRNDGAGNFATHPTTLEGVIFGAVAWGDYDNDGDLDLLLAGESSTGAKTILYRNEAGALVPSGIALQAISHGAAAWGDSDTDGDLDLLLTGQSAGAPVTLLYRNDQGTLHPTQTPLLGLTQSAAAWGDYDNDSDVDLLLAGESGEGAQTILYRNEHSLGEPAPSFMEVPLGLPTLQDGSLAWGDYDNDGDLDLLLAGQTPSGAKSAIYRNTDGQFTLADVGLTNVTQSTTAWGDSDNDGDLDFLLTGADGSATPVTLLYANRGSQPNRPPTSPTGLSEVVQGNQATLHWEAGSDEETPPPGLTYNLRVGTTPGGTDVLAPLADPISGTRWLPTFGGAGPALTATLTSLAPDTTYYWSVQTVDSGFAGSAFAAEGVFSTRFPAVAARLPGVAYSQTAAWGDYDQDGDLDLALNGATTDTLLTTLYENAEEGFIASQTTLPGIRNGTLVWGDYDGDNDLDLLLTGFNYDLHLLTRLYRNEGEQFTLIESGLPGLSDSAAAWGDYDQDGDLDLLLLGDLHGDISDPNPVTKLFRNDQGSFTDMHAGLPRLAAGAVDWGDYDNDSDPDLLLAGQDQGLNPITQLYRNDGGLFTSVSLSLPGIYWGGMGWGDYDNDGWLDFFLVGWDVAQVYHNNAGQGFTPQALTLGGLSESDGAWGDYDNDGDLDLLLSGRSPLGGPLTRIYRNDGGQFVDLGDGLLGVSSGSVAWADYDSDGTLELIATGTTEDGLPVTRLYENHAPITNTRPTPPLALSAITSGTTALLSWEAGHDAETPPAGLTYNLRVGTSPGGTDVVSPMADPTSGVRYLPRIGGAGHGLTATLTLPPGTYVWSVQTLDTSFQGSPFATEGTLVVDGGLCQTTDVTGDGATTIQDIQRVAATFQDETAPTAYDLDCDGVVTVMDVQLVAWGWES